MAAFIARGRSSGITKKSKKEHKHKHSSSREQVVDMETHDSWQSREEFFKVLHQIQIL